jgi:hypothetical protein
VDVREGGRFVELRPEPARHLLALHLADHALLLEVAFVAADDDRDLRLLLRADGVLEELFGLLER